jgi:hypothetical protein
MMRGYKFCSEMARAHTKEAARSLGKKVKYHLMMKVKWEQAADNHTYPVEPDPPPPER